ncbi:acetoacetate decarboxylase family protein [Tsukamurella sp. 8F]|uniref:acetoacetate decarboxylase family protein n=1 Tax=unclassified Tsukamurella TaxID=2633480 RepID=UPI0023B96B78|nr:MULTISPECIES: acetoacetate decarboxylase family protein [unclassified Tsukamurella]MDF0531226.1 acetoacetate decarboxylase family protein [Tsukamurella sp. 8J]MDF0588495.1 acetoacetate decarboxylase family protein [Tsukamurella sp. 8F]
MTNSTAATVEVDLGGRTVSVPRGGLFDRYRMDTPLDEVAADPLVPGVDFFRTLPKTKVDSPIGTTRTPNFYYAMSSARLTMIAPSSAIRRRIPRELAPLEIAPGLGVVSLMLFRYDVCDIDFYTEAAVGVAVRPARHGGITTAVADVVAALGDDHLHSYVLSLPVNTEIAQVRGHDGYGFPKWVTDLDVDIDAGRTSARISGDDGGVDIAFSAPTPTQKSFASGEKVSTLTSYTKRDGAWHSTLNQTNILAGGTSRFPRGFDLTLGRGRMSDDLRALKPIRTIQFDANTSAQAALHMPVPFSVR